MALTTALVGVVEVSAHRLDEYLQAARLAIDPDRVQVELDLTPGIALAEAFLADIDRDHDGSLSVEEQRAYGSLVVSALTLEVDGTRLPVQLGASSFPAADAVRRGEGTIRLQSTATLPRLSMGPHQLLFRNSHYRDHSVYLANALLPQSDLVAIMAQRRDGDQTELTINYDLRAALATSTAALLFGSLAAVTGLSALLIRASRLAVKRRALGAAGHGRSDSNR